MNSDETNGVGEASTTSPLSNDSNNQASSSMHNQNDPTTEYGFGLRRSARERVPRKRDIYEIDPSVYLPKKKKPKSKATKKVVASKSKDAKAKNAKVKPQQSDKSKVKKSSTPKPPVRTPEIPIPVVNNKDWTANIPLYNSELRNQNAKISRLKNENMKAVPYAGDILKIMSFVNKFNYFFVNELQSLSFQDFEIGLDLYPDPLINTGKEIQRLYADYIPVKEVVGCQDKMNLLLLTIMDLLFRPVETEREPQVEWSDLKSTSKKTFQSYIEKIRLYAPEWGYPKEWRKNISTETLMKPASSTFEKDDIGPAVDQKHKEILTPNIYQWPANEPIDIDQDPLQTKGLQRTGILALEAKDRIVFLRTLVDWCCSYSPLLHHEIYILTHYKRDPPFGIQTKHVPRYLLQGLDETFSYYKKLCNLVQSRLEIRSKKKHVKKQMKEGKNDEIVHRLEILQKLKTQMKGKTEDEKLKLMIENYDDWEKVFKGETPENPLSNPYEDKIYKLRSEEFFIGRVPHVGDFYLPRMQTYEYMSSMNTYTDLKTLDNIFNTFESKKYNPFTLFENDSPFMSSNFKILFHDKIALIQDVISGADMTEKNYWYEMCYDSETLLKFIDFIDQKIQQPSTAEPEKEEIRSENGDPSSLINGVSTKSDVSPTSGQNTKKKQEKSEESSKDASKINPLPKNPQFNSSRRKFAMLQTYLRRIQPILAEFEEMKTKFGDINPTKRQSRRSQRREINYKIENSDDEYAMEDSE
ncbi:ISWI one complex protein 3 [Nakaseomyces glabratus]|nr:ISWI one complex protein 3 [Nakaseomyces glabratus]KTB25826.1 ISWI one complex protein 3 [Nakaseomyces glabratus]